MKTCELCKGRGWLLTFLEDRYEIQKCDECNIFEDDKKAGESAQNFIKNLKIKEK